MEFKVDKIALYSEKQGNIGMRGVSGSFVTIYVPIEQVNQYKLGDTFVLTRKEQ